jgi:hypothetical protein
MDSSRIGKFAINMLPLPSEELINDVFKDILIIRAEYIFSVNEIHYQGISNKFDSLETGEKLPWYSIIGTVKDGKVIYHFERDDEIKSEEKNA